jgi:hypothetical protein
MAKTSKLEHAAPKANEPGEAAPIEPGKTYAKSVELGLGTHLLGTVLSIKAQRGTLLEVGRDGVTAVSGKNGRRVLVPWANIKACELYPDAPKAA